MPARKIARRFLDLPVRRKLILSFLIIIFLGGVISLYVGTRLVHQTVISLAEAKVRHDLSSAWTVYEERLNSIRDIVRLSATREVIKEALRSGRFERIAATYDAIRRDFGLDVLSITDARGLVALRSRLPGAAAGDDMSQDPCVRLAFGGQAAAGIQIVSREELLKEGPDLAERARFQFVPTPMAAARPEDHEERGMMLKAAAPVLDEKGALLGVLYGGLLLNRLYELVDRVNDIVFKGE